MYNNEGEYIQQQQSYPQQNRQNSFADCKYASRMNAIRGYIRTVEKECNSELDRMEDSLCNLRSIRKYWDNYNMRLSSAEAMRELDDSQRRIMELAKMGRDSSIVLTDNEMHCNNNFGNLNLAQEDKSTGE